MSQTEGKRSKAYLTGKQKECKLRPAVNWKTISLQKGKGQKLRRIYPELDQH